MQAQRQEQLEREPNDPIRSLVHGMHDDEVLRVYRKAVMPDRLERLVEWPPDIAGDSQLIREKFGCGKYVVRVMKKRANGSLVIRSSIVVDIKRWEVTAS